MNVRINYFNVILFLLTFYSNSYLFAKENIIGGQNAEQDAYPWMVGIAYKGNYSLYDAQFCGGSLIAPYWVVTAGHCIQGLKVSSINIVFDAYSIMNPEPGFRKVSVDTIILHENYNIPNELDNDIALIKLSEPMMEGQSIQMVTPEKENLIIDGIESTTLGWGLVNENTQEYGDTLQKVNINVIDNTTCASNPYYAPYINASVMCAGNKNEKKGSCSGDSGGPLFIDDNGQSLLVGLASWVNGADCGSPGSPGVYTRLAYYYNWLVEKTGIINSYVKQNDSENNFKVLYVDGKVLVQHQSKLNINRSYQLEIYAIDGQKVYSQFHTLDTDQILDIRDVAKGLLLVSIKNENTFFNTLIPNYY